MGFKPVYLHYGLMFITAITAVGAFKVVGSILVVALMITPAATSYLLSKRLSVMLLLAMFFGIISVFSGYTLATFYDTSISGSIVTMLGFIFLLVFLCALPNGVLIKLFRFKQQKREFAAQMLLVQLCDHEDKPIEIFELTMTNMVEHMDWTIVFQNELLDIVYESITSHGKETYCI